MQKIYAFIPHFSFASRFRLLLLLLSRLCLPFFFFFACLSCAPVYAILASFARFKYFQSNLTRIKKNVRIPLPEIIGLREQHTEHNFTNVTVALAI